MLVRSSSTTKILSPTSSATGAATRRKRSGAFFRVGRGAGTDPRSFAASSGLAQPRAVDLRTCLEVSALARRRHLGRIVRVEGALPERVRETGPFEGLEHLRSPILHIGA